MFISNERKPMNKRFEIVINGVNLPFYADDDEIITSAKNKMKRAGLNTARLHFRIFKKSVDARRKEDIRSISSVLVNGEGLEKISEYKLKEIGASGHWCEPIEIKFGEKKLSARPIIVGSGPAGMFCGLLLARHGYAPIIIERGKDVDERVRSVESFYSDHILDTESNIQFGAGGAGTFSDGKLVTRITDPRCALVLEMLVEFGAPADILIKAKPHIGTDILRQVVKNIFAEIRRLGGEIICNCRFEDFIEYSDIVGVLTSNGEMKGGALVLAVGHSARDTYSKLIQKKLVIEPKPFSVGVRVEHLQEDIDTALYGRFAGDERLGRGEYTLSDTTGERGVYTFCMCPGGEVMGAASEEGGVVVNGMSYHARNGKNANSAVAVGVSTNDYGNDPKQAIAFQRNIERTAFTAGGGGYTAPIQTMEDFLNGVLKHEPMRIQPTYMNGNVAVCNIEEILPCFVTEALRRGFASFGRKIKGFDAADAILTGVETRTSSPVRILRNEAFTAIGRELIYPCGEGAGYSGGITSSAVDGIKVAQAIMARYTPIEDEKA